MRKKQKIQNEIYAIHFNGELLYPDIWREYTDNYGRYGLQGWRPAKKFYYKIGHAKAALHHLPIQIRDKCEIVRYIPEKINEPSTII